MLLVPIYELRRDREQIELVQSATLTKPGFGIQPRPALFGSDEWWSAIGTDRLPVHVRSGLISRVFWGSMGDWPEFALVGDDGFETTWTRHGDIARYVEGLRAEVHYVVQWFKEDSFMASRGGSLEHNVVLEVQVEESNRRSESTAPGPGGHGLRGPRGQRS